MWDFTDSTIEELEEALTTAHDNVNTAVVVIGRKSVDCSQKSKEVPNNLKVKC